MNQLMKWTLLFGFLMILIDPSHASGKIESVHRAVSEGVSSIIQITAGPLE